MEMPFYIMAGYFVMAWAALLMLALSLFCKRWWSRLLCILAIPAQAAANIGICIYFDTDLPFLPLALLFFLASAISGLAVDD